MTKNAFFIANLFLGLVLCGNVSQAQPQKVQIAISGIKSDKGQIVLNVFKDEESYKDEKPFKRIPFEKRTLADGTMSVAIQLDPGIYGITLLDDENKNGKMEKNMLKIPKEGFGFSNFYMSKLKRPAFDDFKVKVTDKTQSKVEIKVKYM